MTRRDWVIAVAAATGAGWVTACSQGTPALAYDIDECAFCRMTISDRRFGAAARTSKGRPVTFDSIECLAGWLEAQDPSDVPTALWVTDAMVPGELVPISTVRFHRAAAGTSPMGRGYVAVTSTRGATPWDGVRLSWAEIRAEVARGVAPTIPNPLHEAH